MGAEFIKASSCIYRCWTECDDVFEFMGGGILHTWKFAVFGGYRHARCNLIIMATEPFGLYFCNVLHGIVDGTIVLER